MEVLPESKLQDRDLKEYVEDMNRENKKEKTFQMPAFLYKSRILFLKSMLPDYPPPRKSYILANPTIRNLLCTKIRQKCVSVLYILM